MTEEHLESLIGPGPLENIHQTITEMMWNREYKHNIPEGENGHVYISDVVMINACNHISSGSFWWNDVEYSFEYESGDWSGSLFRQISDTAPIPVIDYRPEPLAIAPLNYAQCTPKNAAFMITKWKLFETREDVQTLLRNYGYDRTFAPGSKTENHYRDKFSKLGIKIVTKSTARDIEAQLKNLADKVCN